MHQQVFSCVLFKIFKFMRYEPSIYLLYYWDKIDKRIYKLFLEPSFTLVFLFLSLIAIWLISPTSWRRPISGLFFCLTVAYLSLFTSLGSWLVVQGMTVWLPQYRGQTADAIVVLGRGGAWADLQAEAASELWSRQRAPIIFVSGTSYESQRLYNQLVVESVPSEFILGEHCSRSTEDNAGFTTAVLSTALSGSSTAADVGLETSVSKVLKHEHSIILVTDEPHMLRSLLTFRSFGFRVVPYPVKLSGKLDDFEISALTLREYGGLVSYFLLGRFQERSWDFLEIKLKQRSFSLQDCKLLLDEASN